LFYDLSTDTPRLSKEFRSGGGRTQLENLERYCNKLAAAMLLPKPLLKKSLKSLSSVEPDALLQLAEEAGVSIETLVRRFADEGQLLLDPFFRGCIVLVKGSGSETTVVAVAKPPRINIATGLLLMRPGERWQLLAAGGATLNPDALATCSEVSMVTE